MNEQALENNAMPLSIREVSSRTDSLLPAVMDIYQESFPLREQVRVSWWLSFLQEKEAGRARHRHLLAAMDGDAVVGFAYYEIEPEARFGYLWYLATSATMRSKGLGAWLYHEVSARVYAAECDGLIFEVELPEDAARFSAEDAEWAHRRIAWYRRQGARLLQGIEYVQEVGWQPPYPMGIMIASQHEITPRRAFEVVQSILGDAVREVAPLALQ